MTLALRTLLIAGALVTLIFMLLRIRAAKVQIKDSIVWILLSLVLLVLAIFPQLPIAMSRWFGIESPINFVYLVIIFVLLIKQFADSLRISRMDAKVQQLAQRLALEEKNRDEGRPRQADGGN